jgi:hypothetical protein
MLTSPEKASTINQIIMIGPNTAPIPAVPRFCIRKSVISAIRVTGMTYGLSNGVATSSPSTALKTDMAGVMTPSP